MSLSRDNLSTAITEHSGQLQHHDVIMSHYPWWLKKTMMSGWHLTLNYPFAESVMSKTDYCQLIMKVSGQVDITKPMRGSLSLALTNQKLWEGGVSVQCTIPVTGGGMEVLQDDFLVPGWLRGYDQTMCDVNMSLCRSQQSLSNSVITNTYITRC